MAAEGLWMEHPSAGTPKQRTLTSWLPWAALSPTYVLVAVTAAVSHPLNLRAMHTSHAGEECCLRAAKRFGKFLIKRFLHAIRMIPKSFFQHFHLQSLHYKQFNWTASAGWCFFLATIWTKAKYFCLLNSLHLFTAGLQQQHVLLMDGVASGEGRLGGIWDLCSLLGWMLRTSGGSWVAVWFAFDQLWAGRAPVAVLGAGDASAIGTTEKSAFMSEKKKLIIRL